MTVAQISTHEAFGNHQKIIPKTPNYTTLNIFEKTDKKQELHFVKNIDELFKDLGI